MFRSLTKIFSFNYFQDGCLENVLEVVLIPYAANENLQLFYGTLSIET